MPDIGRDIVSLSDPFVQAGFSSGQIVFMGSDGVLTEDADFTHDPSTKLLTVGGNIAFKSGTGFTGTFDHANTANRIYTLPDAAGTIVIGGAGSGVVVNSDISPSAGIVYSKLVLTGSIVDGDIVSITTRAKLPSQIAYEDEANTFSGTLTMSGANITLGSNLITFSSNYQIRDDSGSFLLERTGANNAVFLVKAAVAQTVQTTLFRGDATNFERMAWAYNAGATRWEFNSSKGGTATLRPYVFLMDSNVILTVSIANAVDANSRTWSNFVASSPTFSGTVALGTSTLNYSVFRLVQNGTAATLALTPISGNTDGVFEVRPSGTSTTAIIRVSDSTGIAGSENLNDVRISMQGGLGYLQLNRNTGGGSVPNFIIRTIQATGATINWVTFNHASGTMNISVVGNSMIDFTTTTMNFNSRTISNMVGASPTFSGTVALGTSTVSGTPTFSGAVVFSGGPSFITANLTITDVDVVLGTTTGTMIGTAANQKVAFHGATPVIQAAHIADPAGGVTEDAEARAAINAILVVLEDKGFTAAA